MTIKELENRTGMTRANIRFYEAEGLLSPKRLGNGYRDYSEQDARTLEKIQLLRKLQLDIDTIRKVQDGTLTLEQALFAQTTRLEGDKAVIERAAQVCRELERSGVEYAALEPQPWLEQLKASARSPLPQPAPASAPVEEKRDLEPRACYCPWQRCFARALDISLYDVLINVLFLLTTRSQSLIELQANAVGSWIWGLGILLLTLALEPLWLHFWGWTPGKWVFGLKLRDGNGEKLSFAQAKERCRRLTWEGYGWNLPGYSLWQFWKGRVRGMEGRDSPWDAEEDYRYTKVERRIHGGWVFGAVKVLCFAATLLAGVWSMLPPCRGPLDLPEFARNYNHSLRVEEYSGETLIPTLDDNGQWVEREQPDGTITFSLFGDTTVYENPEYTLGSGVTAVTLRMKSEDKIVGGSLRERLVLLSLCRSAGKLNLFNILPVQEEAVQLLDRWEDFEEDFYGVHVSQQVESEGYEPTNAFGASLWCENEDTPHHCERTVTFSIIGNEGGGVFSPSTVGEDRAPD